MGEPSCLKPSPGATAHCVADGRQDAAGAVTARGKGRLPVLGELMSGGLSNYQGTRQRAAPHPPSAKNSHKLGPGSSKQEGQSGEQGVGEAGPGQAEEAQGAREQSSE